jgi:hypothetical protein
MSLDAVSRQYRQITGQDHPTDAKKAKGAKTPKPDETVVVEPEATEPEPEATEPEPKAIPDDVDAPEPAEPEES